MISVIVLWRTERHLLSVHWVALLELLKDPNFDLAGIAILRNGSDDLYGDFVIGLRVDSFYDLPKCPLA
jgi:hypothetical protein